jgi:hypothetical protein
MLSAQVPSLIALLVQKYKYRSIIEAFKGLEECDTLDAVSAGTQFTCFVYLLYWYKNTNTDT